MSMLDAIERQIKWIIESGNQPVPKHLLEYREYLRNKEK